MARKYPPELLLRIEDLKQMTELELLSLQGFYSDLAKRSQEQLNKVGLELQARVVSYNDSQKNV